MQYFNINTGKKQLYSIVKINSILDDNFTVLVHEWRSLSKRVVDSVTIE